MLNDYLKRNNISRVAFAKKIGVTSQCVSQWCHGTTIPRADTLQSIFDETGGEVPIEFWTRKAKERSLRK